MLNKFLFSGGKTPDVGSRTYTEIMREQMLRGEESEVSFFTMKMLAKLINWFPKQVRKKLAEKHKDGTLNGDKAKKRGRWDQAAEVEPTAKKKGGNTPGKSWEEESAVSFKNAI